MTVAGGKSIFELRERVVKRISFFFFCMGGIKWLPGSKKKKKPLPSCYFVGVFYLEDGDYRAFEIETSVC